MKKHLMIALFAMFSLLTISCSSDDNSEEQIIGKSGDNIKLSQKTANFSPASNSITITSQTKGWWLNGITLNKEKVDLSNFANKLSENFTVTTADFQVERKNGNTIIITMNANSTSVDRELTIALQNGNYHDEIKVIQSK